MIQRRRPRLLGLPRSSHSSVALVARHRVAILLSQGLLAARGKMLSAAIDEE